MTNLPALENTVRSERTRRGLSQEELARRAGISRAGISAIETGRLVPSAAAALALAAAFGCRVEDLFRLPRLGPQGLTWAWPPLREPWRYWRADVAGRVRLYPVEATPLGTVAHDGVSPAETLEGAGRADLPPTLLMACCDPAVGLIAAELARAAGVRLIALSRSSQAALALLRQGLVHVAGVHLARVGKQGGNAGVVRERLGAGYHLLKVARWEEGIAFTAGLRLASIRDAVRPNLRWIGREAGSGARQCLDEVLGERTPPRRLAHDHRGVAEAVRLGWADAGVCLRLVSEEAGLGFLGVRQEVYDLCYPAALKDDSRILALVAAVRSTSYRRLLGQLPGYDGVETGEIERVV
jgi:molybdate-binding protein/transcriptional regulator with XRE-family HTH domain